MSTTEIIPSALSEPHTNLEQRIEQNSKDLSGFHNSFNKFKELFTYFRDETSKGRKRYYSSKVLSNCLEKDTFVINDTTAISLSKSVIGFGLVLIPFPTEKACELSLTKKVFIERIGKKNINTKKSKRELDRVLTLWIIFQEMFTKQCECKKWMWLSKLYFYKTCI